VKTCCRPLCAGCAIQPCPPGRERYGFHHTESSRQMGAAAP